MVKILTFLLAAILSSSALAAQVVVISDIDDTIKISRVRSWGGVGNAFDTEAVFKGMPELFQGIASLPDYKIYYLTNATEKVMGKSHRKFLRDNQFPGGEVIFRGEHDKEEHKILHLREIVRRDRPLAMVLIGDNGQHDIAIYDQVAREFPGIRMHQYIRTLYNPRKTKGILPIREGQRTFASPVEIALGGVEERWLPPLPAVRLAERQIREYLTDLRNPPKGYPAYLKDWMDLSEYVWSVGDCFKFIPGIDAYRQSLPPSSRSFRLRSARPQICTGT